MRRITGPKSKCGRLVNPNTTTAYAKGLIRSRRSLGVLYTLGRTCTRPVGTEKPPPVRSNRPSSATRPALVNKALSQTQGKRFSKQKIVKKSVFGFFHRGLSGATPKIRAR